MTTPADPAPGTTGALDASTASGTSGTAAPGDGGLVRMLGDAVDAGAAAQERLHSRLVDRAERDRLLDVAYSTMETPVGSLLLAATEEGLIRVAYDVQGHDAALADLAERVSPRVLRAPGRLAQAVRQIEEYFDGRRTRFELALDLRLTKGFRREVITHLPGIGYGRTESYAQVAAAAGSPRAVRAVGTACATNPLPVVIPCHRVVRSDGSAGGYAGGPEAKSTLLRLEAAA
ncbi:methylated-DNA--[protein]-cysteine S-methyltransferase [Streptomyces sp. WMMB 322]|uniref:methylated-DNA--[protein]-cysteine S-methyltransferase n=1 Tax=Streptomyces sp. WMMB 322 TaxID=1286821 RepID=UPI000823CEE1|nr:methylated-DNA--[protein]-cysteine S-methyltransferase [Streptomyces sp. WMMB 322]SCK45423.1 methylated-DNA-[protein]-cysteine S-methyltransferase [Streptomyces sp. WMMB 322]